MNIRETLNLPYRLIRCVSLCLSLSLALSGVGVHAQCGGGVTTPVTVDDESATVGSGARQLVNGAGTSVNTSVPSKISIDVQSPAPLSITTYSGGSNYSPAANSYTRVTSASAVYLPPTASVPIGTVVGLTIGGSQGATTVSTNAGAGTEHIQFNNGTPGSITIKNGDQIFLTNLGGGYWMVYSYLPYGGTGGSAWDVSAGGTGAATASAARSNLGAASSGANSDITSLSGLATPLSVAQGGTGASTASAARTNLSAASSGANSDITSISGLTTPLAVSQGGTGKTL